MTTLHQALTALADEWEQRGSIIPAPGHPHRPAAKVAVERIRQVLAAHPEPVAPEATEVEEWGVRDPICDDGPFEEDVARRFVAEGWQARLIHRTATYRAALVLDQASPWVEVETTTEGGAS